MERLRIRPYRQTDFAQIVTWITDEESHLKWCANTLPFGFSQEEFENLLQEQQREMNDMGFVATDETGCPVGFFRLSVNNRANTGFFKCIVVDGARRGIGLGKRMMTKAVQFAFSVLEVEEVRLIVFDDNPAAAACYEKVGFQAECTIEPLSWKGRDWKRTRLVLRRQ